MTAIVFFGRTLNSSSLKHYQASLEKYKPSSAIPKIAGLLTVPVLQANTL